MTDVSFSGIGLEGRGLGQLRVLGTGLDWRDKSGGPPVTIERESISSAEWGVYGSKAQLKVLTRDGSFTRLDGFAKADLDKASAACKTALDIDVSHETVAAEGNNFGDVSLASKLLVMKGSRERPVMEIKLDAVAQCVVPANRDEIEIQFHETEGGDREADSLVQITLHLADIDDDDKDDEEADREEGDAEGREGRATAAEKLQQLIMNAGVIASATGNVIAEFSREQGTFVTPRGRYSVQMTASYFRMQGAQYDYKILYADISSLFLLPKPDDVRTAFVISLEKPIRQGNQKYQHLVLETTRLEHSMTINLSEEEIADKYESQLAPVLTMPMCNLFAKIFKVLSQSTVYVPKHFLSDRQSHCVKCSLKANEGLLYPLAKSFIFIHKPTLIIKFEDVESVEFQRYKANAMSATRNFDMIVTVTAKSLSAGDARDYNFSGIDRAEYGNLQLFLSSKKMRIKEEADTSKPISLDWEEGGGEEGSEEEDDDYDDDKKSGSGSGSGSDDGSDSNDSADEAEAPPSAEKKTKIIKPKKVKPDKVKPDKVKPERKEKSPKIAKRKAEPEDKVEKKKRAKKDKNAPKGAKSAYAIYVQETRADLKTANPAASFGDLARLSAEAWKTLSPEDRALYDGKAKADKERFNVAMREYNSKKNQQDEIDEGVENNEDDEEPDADED